MSKKLQNIRRLTKLNEKQLIFRGLKKGDEDPLMKIERDAINKVKEIWKTFKT